MRTYYVYILTTKANKLLYIGVTNNLQRRIYEHKNKSVKGFASKHNINKLVYYEETNDINVAISREKKLKGRLKIKKDNIINEFNPNWKYLYEDIIG